MGPTKTQQEHFDLFSLVLERGFAVHTGPSGRLVVRYRLGDSGQDRYLPRIHPKPGVSFRIAESTLKPSELYLYYDPAKKGEIPKLAYFCPQRHCFLTRDSDLQDSLAAERLQEQFPVVKLASLKGLHYMTDVVCLQLFTLDLGHLRREDAILADQVYSMLERKLRRFREFSQPWERADRAEQVAQEYLARHGESNPQPAPSGERLSPAEIVRRKKGRQP
ncbi:hypothetical protein HBA55_27225 [Pseudomaricurvus alkylphenolicus]|uniref:hypothetical protein n=1 Tax=Pseudomaricurvus alkylphenolicus TaxID=1306991 RepID=UPI0014212FDA|nr:hypothetical protein [Pseudomaricurvus alkylphenolicus]NIB43330.1 hypothetical protein [Pseudomaricurvus alkylphenolicus]